MKHLLFLTLLLIGLVSFAQSDSTKTGPILTFLNKTIDYDTIERYDNGYRTFTFYNTGDEPLIIKRVKSGCSCTVTKLVKDTIMPGERGEITAKYNTKKPGKFNRKLTVYSNSSVKQVTYIYLRGFVLDSKRFYGVERKKKK